MRILVANIPLPHNRFLVDLNNAIARSCEIRQSSDAFWEMEGEFDIVHLHFPHYITYEIERASQTTLTDGLMSEVAKRLRFWSGKARIVVTRHVLLPHDAEFNSPWEKMYEMVYSYADAVVHFGNASIDEFRARYRAMEFARGREPTHRVIPHQNYASLPNVMGRAAARSRLGIQPNSRVMLVFGAIRSDAERELILTTFKNSKARGKVLLVSTWREILPEIAWIRFKYWMRDLQRFYYRLHPSYNFGYSFVPEEDTQVYLNAADILFIPRLRVLNSGNVTLGMTFGRVVVGPDSLDVGEILRAAGNPVFDPDTPASAAAAVDRGFQLATNGSIGQENARLAAAEWSVERCARDYVDLFAELASLPGARIKV
jgi:glycosyltransferase involved in cell wall biosynthesis